MKLLPEKIANSNLQNKFVIDNKSETLLKNKLLLLDTNALIDAYRLPNEFYLLLKEFESLDCAVVTTKTICGEFIGGTKNPQSLNQKVAFLEELFGKKLHSENLFLNTNSTFPESKDFLEFSRQANKFSLVDFEIFTLLKQLNDVLLISRNHKDFTTRLVYRISFITLLGIAEIHTYGVYQAKT